MANETCQSISIRQRGDSRVRPPVSKQSRRVPAAGRIVNASPEVPTAVTHRTAARGCIPVRLDGTFKLQVPAFGSKHAAGSARGHAPSFGRPGRGQPTIGQPGQAGEDRANPFRPSARGNEKDTPSGLPLGPSLRGAVRRPARRERRAWRLANRQQAGASANGAKLLCTGRI